MVSLSPGGYEKSPAIPPAGFAYAVTTQFGGPGLGFSVPGGQLALFMVIAIVVGVLAAVLPARRASRVDILQAIPYE